MENLTSRSGWDTIIAGGGPSGSASAILLAQAGKKVLLIEKETTAHHKVCGEFISYEARRYLNLLGISLPHLGAVSVRRLRLVQGLCAAETELPFTGYSLSRKILDETLLGAAQQAGASVLRGETVTEINEDNASPVVSTRGSGKWECKTIFLATGKHDLAYRKRRHSGGEDLIGFKMHYRAFARTREMATLFFFPGGYAGLEPVENDILNLCLVVKKDVYARCRKNWNSLLTYIQTTTPLLAEELACAVPCWKKPLAVYPIPYGFLHRHEDRNSRIYRLGDQMAVIPSFCGEGISIALHTAMKAARACLDSDSAAAYHRDIRSQLQRQMRWANLLSGATGHPLLQKGVVKSCEAFPGMIGYIAEKTRLKNIADHMLE